MDGIRHLFFDLDHTIWDFETNSLVAFRRMFDDLDIETSIDTNFQLFHKTYLIHNKHYWNLYAQGKISQHDLRWKRMYETLKTFAVEDVSLAQDMGRHYLQILPEGNTLFPYTQEILRYLQSKKYKLHILSNGFEEVQLRKLEYSGISEYFDQIITSEASEYAKPDKKIFTYALAKVGATNTECVMLGDSPEADLQGAYNAQIKSVYVNHNGQATDIPHDYVIRHLQELESIF